MFCGYVKLMLYFERSKMLDYMVKIIERTISKTMVANIFNKLSYYIPVVCIGMKMSNKMEKYKNEIIEKYSDIDYSSGNYFG